MSLHPLSRAMLQIFFILSALYALVAGRSIHVDHIRRPHQALAKRVEGNMTLWKRVDNARWTFYNAETGQAGSCGQFLSNSGFTVAVNAAQMNPGLCFKTITMSFGGKTTTATIQDTCPGCPWGGLDLTPGLFSFFADQSLGVISGSWDFTDAAPPPAPSPPTASSSSSPSLSHSPATTPTTQTVSVSVSRARPPPPPPSSSSHKAATSSSPPQGVAVVGTTTVPRPSSTASSNQTNPASGLGIPTQGPSNTGNGQVNNIEMMYQVFVQIGGAVMVGTMDRW